MVRASCSLRESREAVDHVVLLRCSNRKTLAMADSESAMAVLMKFSSRCLRSHSESQESRVEITITITEEDGPVFMPLSQTEPRCILSVNLRKHNRAAEHRYD